MLLRVAVPALNVRSQPRVAPANRLAVLPQGHAVNIAGAAPAPWRRITASLGGAAVDGFVHGGHLSSDASERRVHSVQDVHLQEGRVDVTPHSAAGRAFPIGDPARPRWRGESRDRRLASVAGILAYLDVERSARYAPTGASTYCNVYAYDLCYLAGAYLPRVWWKGGALERLGRGESVLPRYDATLREMRANDLYDWFSDYGARFGWRRTYDLDDLQEAANDGRIGVIVAQRVQLGRPGHISVVVPETATTATRRNGAVRRPVQSQAGRKNYQSSPGTRAWWQGAQFRAFGLWARVE